MDRFVETLGASSNMEIAFKAIKDRGNGLNEFFTG
jgi:hypothetical protein